MFFPVPKMSFHSKKPSAGLLLLDPAWDQAPAGTDEGGAEDVRVADHVADDDGVIERRRAVIARELVRQPLDTFALREREVAQQLAKRALDVDASAHRLSSPDRKGIVAACCVNSQISA